MRNHTLSYYILIFLMLSSGFAGISYEILYGRIFGNMVGDQFIVSAAVLMTFLLGIGMGSITAHRLWRWLWLIEGGIGLYGVLIAFNQPWLDSVIYSGAGFFEDHLVGSVWVCVFLLITPAFLIGCSVPLFAGYFNRFSQGDDASFSWVYMVYNLGAALTALLIEFFFIRALGIQGTVFLFASANVLVAVLLRIYFYSESSIEESVNKKDSLKALLMSIPKSSLLALCLASIASAIFQLFMLKYSELIFGPFRESFALVLSLILLGITLGSWLVKRFELSFEHLMWWNLCGLLWLMLVGGGATYIYASLYPLTDESFWAMIILKWSMLVVLMFVPAITFGATIPALLSHNEEVSRESGALLFISALANVAGFLLMVFLLHRYLDYGVQLLIVGLISGAALFVCFAKNIRNIIILSLLLIGIGGAYAQKWDEDLLYLSYTNFKDVDDLVDARENVSFPDRYKGYQDVFSINWMDGDPYFFINGYISIPLNNPSEKEVGAISSLFSPRLDDALVLGLGSGATASTVGLFFDKTDVVEINPVVRENLFRMKPWHFSIEHNPNMNIIVDDAIHYTKATDKTYSLILNTVTTPLYFSSSKLYTTDFFRNIKGRLNDDGVYVTWMDSRIGDEGADIILRSLKKSFKHCAISYIKGAYFLLIASDKPLVMQQQKAVTENKILKKNLMDKHRIMSEWLPYHLMNTDVFALIGNQQGDVNTADYPALEFEMSRLQSNDGVPEFKSRLRASFDINQVKKAMMFVPNIFPADYLAQVEERLGDSSITRRWQKLLQPDKLGDKPEQAELRYRKVKMDMLKRVDDMHAYGYQLLRLKHYQEAIDVFQHISEQEPEHDNAYYNIGVCYEHLGQYANALEAFQNEMRVDPKDEDVQYRIGRMQVRLGQYKKAVVLLTAYINQQNLKRGKVYFYRAVANRALGYQGLAKEDMAKALRLTEKEMDLRYE